MGGSIVQLEEWRAGLRKQRLENTAREFCELGKQWQKIFTEDLPVAMIGRADRPLIKTCLEKQSKRPFQEMYEELASETEAPRFDPGESEELDMDAIWRRLVLIVAFLIILGLVLLLLGAVFALQRS